MKTYSAKPGEVERRWYVVDADGKVLGRLASEIARVLRGKHKPQYTPHVDVGDFVVVVNAERIALTGKKLSDKWFRDHSGYPGGLKSIWYERLLETHPERAIERAVWGMLPKTRLGRKMVKKLKVYRGPDHPHAAQQPEPLDIGAAAGPEASQIRGMATAQETTTQAEARRAAEAEAAEKAKAAEAEAAQAEEQKAEAPEAEEPQAAEAEAQEEAPATAEPEPEAAKAEEPSEEPPADEETPAEPEAAAEPEAEESKAEEGSGSEDAGEAEETEEDEKEA